jgi:hypothetical protein
LHEATLSRVCLSYCELRYDKCMGETCKCNNYGDRPPIVGLSESKIDSRKLFSYTRLAISFSVKTTDGTDHPVIGKRTMKCIFDLVQNFACSFFPINLLFINVIILQLNYVILFDISKALFREKRMDMILETDI